MFEERTCFSLGARMVYFSRDIDSAGAIRMWPYANEPNARVITPRSKNRFLMYLLHTIDPACEEFRPLSYLPKISPVENHPADRSLLNQLDPFAARWLRDITQPVRGNAEIFACSFPLHLQEFDQHLINVLSPRRCFQLVIQMQRKQAFEPQTSGRR